ncbi:Anaerobic dimethyl sulfoxide reductase chain B [Planctomycetes bacterium Pan216]|uniref:Anaerobic dimethyl sulfoxide reductase chain B n=1 Tax=Kolteria novifilia TaxID=2527975 RepID=A0A518B0K2_9BACT|nr:Anaerobic dimethyl sulfoxide reductase chain B [Planctomycetes bacterium Pan216]
MAIIVDSLTTSTTQDETALAGVSGERLIHHYLQEQQDLTAVERFANAHDASTIPEMRRYYRDLIPLTNPGPGEQFAFQVDLDSCTGCKACVTACHSLNGLDDDEAWRDVGLLHSRETDEPYLQIVTTACHHCVDPACMNGCPVNAYEKDELTGIVRHLDDQCIGCQYCVLKCPYDVPKYNKAKGIVRKCDMCSQRLAKNEAPACVQSCPNSAIRITIVSTEQTEDRADEQVFLPGAPDPSYTKPTTRYRTSKRIPENAIPGDYWTVKKEHAHLPLVIMLVLTQLSVGVYAVNAAITFLHQQIQTGELVAIKALVALFVGLLALGSSTLHLGRPLYAFRAIVGLRKSWLSREIVLFGLFANMAMFYSAYSCYEWVFQRPLLDLGSWLDAGIVTVGVVAIFSSAMIYHDTRRPYWHLGRSLSKFLLTALILGISVNLSVEIVTAAWSNDVPLTTFMRVSAPELCGVLILATLVKMAIDASVFAHLMDNQQTPLKRTAILMARHLSEVTACRFLFALIGGVVIPAVFMLGHQDGDLQNLPFAIIVTSLSLGLSLGAEFAERYLFFTSVAAPKMPGGVPQ